MFWLNSKFGEKYFDSSDYIKYLSFPKPFVTHNTQFSGNILYPNILHLNNTNSWLGNKNRIIKSKSIYLKSKKIKCKGKNENQKKLNNI